MRFIKKYFGRMNHMTKYCPKCGKDTYLTYWEEGKCPHCGAKIYVGSSGGC